MLLKTFLHCKFLLVFQREKKLSGDQLHGKPKTIKCVSPSNMKEERE